MRFISFTIVTIYGWKFLEIHSTVYVSVHVLKLCYFQSRSYLYTDLMLIFLLGDPHNLFYSRYCWSYYGAGYRRQVIFNNLNNLITHYFILGMSSVKIHYLLLYFVFLSPDLNPKGCLIITIEPRKFFWQRSRYFTPIFDEKFQRYSLFILFIQYIFLDLLVNLFLPIRLTLYLSSYW